MPVVEPYKDSRALHFALQLRNARKRMSSVRSRTADDKTDVRSIEVSFENRCHGAGHAPMGGGIFRMIGIRRQGQPCRVGSGGGIPVNTGVLNRGHRTPKTEVILRIHATDE